MLQIRNFSKSYGKNIAVSHLSCIVESGEVVVLLGPNGAGKSTTLQSIVGILKYDGEILLDGISTRLPQSKSKIAYVPEIPELFPLLTVKEHIVYMAKAYGIDPNPQKIDSLLERFDLKDKAHKLGDELSKGMKQKVSICSAIITNPSLIILDEPMVGLDPKAIRELKTLIEELRSQGKTILISTHMLDMMDKLWDRVLMMQMGRLIGDYKRSDQSNEDLEEIYFSLTASQEEVESNEN